MVKNHIQPDKARLCQPPVAIDLTRIPSKLSINLGSSTESKFP